MCSEDKSVLEKTEGERQLDQFLLELETDIGRERIATDAYREAMDAERRGSIVPNESD